MPARVQHRRVSKRQWLSGGQVGKMGAQMIGGEVGDLNHQAFQQFRTTKGDAMTANTPKTNRSIAAPRDCHRTFPHLAGVLSALAIVAAVFEFGFPVGATHAGEPAKGTTKQVDLGGVTLEVVYIPPGEFMMGSTPEERALGHRDREGGPPQGRRAKSPRRSANDASRARLLDGPHGNQRGPVPAFRRGAGMSPTPKSLAVGRSALTPNGTDII